jgi:hypothetical protein
VEAANAAAAGRCLGARAPAEAPRLPPAARGHPAPTLNHPAAPPPAAAAHSQWLEPGCAPPPEPDPLAGPAARREAAALRKAWETGRRLSDGGELPFAGELHVCLRALLAAQQAAAAGGQPPAQRRRGERGVAVCDLPRLPPRMLVRIHSLGALAASVGAFNELTLQTVRAAHDFYRRGPRYDSVEVSCGDGASGGSGVRRAQLLALLTCDLDGSGAQQQLAFLRWYQPVRVARGAPLPALARVHGCQLLEWAPAGAGGCAAAGVGAAAAPALAVLPLRQLARKMELVPRWCPGTAQPTGEFWLNDFAWQHLPSPPPLR